MEVPSDCLLVRLTEDLLFPNAARTKTKIIETVKLHYEPSSILVSDVKRADQNWNAIGNNKIGRVRKRKGIVPMKQDVTPLRHVVLDFTVRPRSRHDVTRRRMLISCTDGGIYRCHWPVVCD